ncbi:MAG: hypothetical protein N2441_07975 [Rhodocyclaceae bacterium]|nr:hypothetical protein [Rhodocyclaceae bacterium]
MTVAPARENDGRLSFTEAVAYVMQTQRPVFCAMPVFGEVTGDEEQTAEGARIFILEYDGDGDWQLRFIAGPFFSNAHAANEVLTPAEVPDSVRALRFLPTAYEPDWLTDQIQLLIQKLVKNSGFDTDLMPDYEKMPMRAADADVVFPVSFIGGREKGAH